MFSTTRPGHLTVRDVPRAEGNAIPARVEERAEIARGRGPRDGEDETDPEKPHVRIICGVAGAALFQCLFGAGTGLASCAALDHEGG